MRMVVPVLILTFVSEMVSGAMAQDIVTKTAAAKFDP